MGFHWEFDDAENTSFLGTSGGWFSVQERTGVGGPLVRTLTGITWEENFENKTCTALGTSCNPNTSGSEDYWFSHSATVSFPVGHSLLIQSLSFDSVAGDLPALLFDTTIAEVTNIADLSLTMVLLPPAVWSFGSGLVGLLGLARRKH